MNGSSKNKLKEPDDKPSKAKKRTFKVIESDPEEDDVIFNKPTPKKQKESGHKDKGKQGAR